MVRHRARERPKRPPLRDYQSELLTLVENGNTIVYLETGTGKTRIATERILLLRSSLRAGGRMAVFLAPTVPLVRQQAGVFREAGLDVVTYSGEENRDARPRAEWRALQVSYDVLVSTPHALLNLLAHAHMDVSQVGLLVLDECHHTRSDHPYAVLMRIFFRGLVPDPNQRPGVLGLTASPHAAEDLESALEARIVTPKDSSQQERYMAKPQVEVCRLPAVQPPQPPQPSQLLSAADPAARQAALTAAALAEPVRILELVEQMVGYAERFSRCRDVTFRRTAFMGQDLPQVEGHGQSAEEGGGPADPDAVWLMDGVSGTKQLEHLRGQLGALKGALGALGLWPALAVAAADLFGPIAAPEETVRYMQGSGGSREAADARSEGGVAGEERQGKEAEGEEGEEDEDEEWREEVAEEERSLLDRVPEWQLGEFLEEGGIGDGTEADMISGHLQWAVRSTRQLSLLLPPHLQAELQRAQQQQEQEQEHEVQQQLQTTGSSSSTNLTPTASTSALLSSPTASLEAHVVRVALMATAWLLVELVVQQQGQQQGQQGQGGVQGGGGELRRCADAILQGFASALCAPARPGSSALTTHPLVARDAGRLQRWAELLLRVVQPVELEQQALAPLGTQRQPTAAAAGGAGGAAASAEGPVVPLLTPSMQWVVQTLLTHSAQHRQGLARQQQQVDGSGDDWAAMLFCQRKVTCLAVHRLLLTLPCSRASDLRPAVFVGNTSAGATARSLAMTGKKQESIRKDFSSGRLNVLISTDVGAEGLDFRRCCLVALLDPPTHVTPFVQCAGRARAPGSRYLLCVRDDKEEEMVAKRRREEAAMVAKALKLSAGPWPRPYQLQGGASLKALQALQAELASLYRVPRTGALACLSTAQGLLESYCRSLPGNGGDVLLQPYYSYDNGLGGFRVTVYLPANCPVARVEGPWLKSKGVARQTACLDALRALHGCGALNDYLEPTFTRRGRMREAQQQDALRRSGLPRVTLTHRLPRALRPPPAASTATSATVTTPPQRSTKPHTRGAAAAASVPKPQPTASTASTEGGGPPAVEVRHLHAFAFSPLPRDATSAHATTSPHSNETRLHSFGLLLHEPLPYDLPPFTAYLPSDVRNAAAEGSPVPTTTVSPVSVRLVCVGPVALTPAQLRALEVADRALERLVVTRGSASGTAGPGGSSSKSSGPAGSSGASGPAPVTHGSPPAASGGRGEGGTGGSGAGPGAGGADGVRVGEAALVAWSERVGLGALRRALREAGMRVEAAAAEAGALATGDATAAGNAEGAFPPPWCLVVPLAEAEAMRHVADTAGSVSSMSSAARASKGAHSAAAKAGGAAAAAAAASAAAVDWAFLQRLASGPVPLQRHVAALPPLRGLGQGGASGDGGPAPVTRGTAGQDAARMTAAAAAGAVDGMAAAVDAAVRDGGGLLLTQTGATLHAYRGMGPPGVGPSSPVRRQAAAEPGSGGTYASRLTKTWHVDPACVLQHQTLVAVSPGTSTTSNVLQPPQLPNPGSRPGELTGPGDGGGGDALLLLPQALAVAPLSLAAWRAVNATASLLWRAEGLVAAAEAEERLLRPAGFMEPSDSTPSPLLPGGARHPVSYALAALTTRAASDPSYDNERLETLGDAVLKYLGTLYTYGKERHVLTSHEGVMSYKRDQLVANEVLARTAYGRGLQRYMRAVPYDMARTLRIRRPGSAASLNGVPPVGTATSADATQLPAAEGNSAAVAAAAAAAAGYWGEPQAGDSGSTSDPWDAEDRAQPGVRGKRLADCVEALVGCHMAAELAGGGAAPMTPTAAAASMAGAAPAEGTDGVSCPRSPAAAPERELASLPLQHMQQELRAWLAPGTDATAGHTASCAQFHEEAPWPLAVFAAESTGAGTSGCSSSSSSGGGRGGGTAAAASMAASLRFCMGLGVLPHDAGEVLQQLLTTDPWDGSPGTSGGARGGGRDGKAVAACAAAVQRATGYMFRNPQLCAAAVTHVSWPYRAPSTVGTAVAGGPLGSAGGAGTHYQLLEFVGDAVVGLVASVWAYRRGGSPQEMSTWREALVRNDTLAALCVASDLYDTMRVRHRQLAAAMAEYATALKAGRPLGGGAAAAAPEDARVVVQVLPPPPAAGQVTAAAAAAHHTSLLAAAEALLAAGPDAVLSYSDSDGDGDDSEGESSEGGGGTTSSGPASSSGGKEVKGNSCGGGGKAPSQAAVTVAAVAAAPKPLADVVEAVVGAVFLDSGGDLAACEQVFRRLLLAHLELLGTHGTAVEGSPRTPAPGAPGMPAPASARAGKRGGKAIGRAVLYGSGAAVARTGALPVGPASASVVQTAVGLRGPWAGRSGGVQLLQSQPQRLTRVQAAGAVHRGGAGGLPAKGALQMVRLSSTRPEQLNSGLAGRRWMW